MFYQTALEFYFRVQLQGSGWEIFVYLYWTWTHRALLEELSNDRRSKKTGDVAETNQRRLNLRQRRRTNEWKVEKAVGEWSCQARCSNCQWETSHIKAEEHLWAWKNGIRDPQREGVRLQRIRDTLAVERQKGDYNGWEIDWQLRSLRGKQGYGKQVLTNMKGWQLKPLRRETRLQEMSNRQHETLAVESPEEREEDYRRWATVSTKH